MCVCVCVCLFVFFIVGWFDFLFFSSINLFIYLFLQIKNAHPFSSYGKRGVKDIIPPDATLLFDVEVVSIQAKPSRGGMSLITALLVLCVFVTVMIFILKRFNNPSKPEKKAKNNKKK